MEDFRKVAVTECYESPLNTRKRFSEKAQEELTASVRQKGVLVPLLVRTKPHKGRTYEILAGARRHRAATAAELGEVPVRLVEASDDEALEIIVLDNLQREDVHALEEAEGYRKLLERSSDVAGLASKVSKSESYIYQRLKLLELIKPAQDAFLADAITPGHAILIARLQPGDQEVALKHCFEERWIGDRRERLLISVRALAAYIERDIHLDLHAVPFPKDDPELLPRAGSCNACPKRTGFSPALFPDVKKKDTCTDGVCFRAKLAAYVERQKAALEEKEGAKPIELSTDWSSNARNKAEKAEERGIVFHGAYREAATKGPNSCEYARRGLVTHGDRDIGKVMLVCTEKTCRVHHRHGSDDSYSKAATARAKAAQRKAKIENETNRRVLLAVRDKLTGKLDAATLQSIATVAYERLTHDAMKHVCGLYDWKAEKRQYGSPDFRAAGRRALAKLSALETTKFLIILTFIGEYHPFSTESAKRLHAAARSYRIDIKAIAKEVAAKMAPKKPKGKAKPKSKGEAKAKAKEKPKGRKAKEPTSRGVPTPAKRGGAAAPSAPVEG